MAATNAEIADKFAQVADLLEIEDANAFRVRAYRNAALTIRDHSRSMADMLAAGEDLSKLPNIGKDLAGKIATIVEQGRLPALDEVMARVPVELAELMQIEGLGPKRVKTLYQALDIASVEDLERAAQSGQIRALPGFGEKTEELIRRHVARYAGAPRRLALLEAERIAKPLLEYLRSTQGVKKATIAGSYRRRKETVGDLDILCTVKRGTDVVARFVAYEAVEEIVSQGTTRSTVRLRGGLQVDLRVVPEVAYGAALHYFTGAKAHNIAVRRLGQRRGYKISEYGVFENESRIAGRTEAEVYAAIGLAWVPPELREDRGEIEAARAGELPVLLEERDLRGDLHCHTSATDGRDTIARMAEAAAARGYEYVAITDHSPYAPTARGLDEKRLRAHLEAIDALNAEHGGIEILKAVEVDILEDGSLDLPGSILEHVDLTVCSVHRALELSREKQTERILRAMDDAHFNVLAHPTGRRIGERAPYAVNLERLVDGALERGCFLELNANPRRLDLSDEDCRFACDKGLKLALSTDSHGAEELGFMRFGVGQARRGWLEAGDVLNTRPLDELRALLRR